MSGGQERVGVGSRFVYGGQIVQVVEIMYAATGVQVVVSGADGVRRMALIESPVALMGGPYSPSLTSARACIDGPGAYWPGQGRGATVATPGDACGRSRRFASAVLIKRRHVRCALAQFGVQRFGGGAIVRHGGTQMEEIRTYGCVDECLGAFRAGESTSDVDLPAERLGCAVPRCFGAFGSWWPAPARRCTGLLPGHANLPTPV